VVVGAAIMMAIMVLLLLVAFLLFSIIFSGKETHIQMDQNA
jgi:hypothetical protein